VTQTGSTDLLVYTKWRIIPWCRSDRNHPRQIKLQRWRWHPTAFVQIDPVWPRIPWPHLAYG